MRLAAAFAAEPELIAALTDPDTSGPRERSLVRDIAGSALQQFPAYADLHYHAGRAAYAAGDHGAAAGHLQRALAVNPQYGDALILVARVELERGRPAEARRYLERALSAGADYPDVHKLLGDVHAAEGDGPAARRAYERALALNPKYAAALAARHRLAAGRSAGGQA